MAETKVDKIAADLERQINKSIKIQFSKWSSLEVEQRISDICEQRLQGIWEHQVIKHNGGLTYPARAPEIKITRYTGLAL